MHSEQHEAWLREAFEGTLARDDARRAALQSCAQCGPELADHEALIGALDETGELERAVLADARASGDELERRRALETSRAAIARLAAPKPRRVPRAWIALAAAAGVALCVYATRAYFGSAAELQTDDPNGRPQLGPLHEFEMHAPLRGPGGELTLAWTPIDGAEGYSLELFADETPLGSPLVSIEDLAAPQCTIPNDEAAVLPKRVHARLRSFGAAGESLRVQQASLALP